MSATAMDSQTEITAKNQGGRPCKYSDKAITNKANQYLEECINNGDKLPTIHGMAVALNVARSTIYQWIENGNKGLSDVVSRMKDYQADRLIDKGLANTYNASITKLLLSKHGYTENPGNSGTSVNVTINRDSIQVETGGQTLEIDTDK